MSEKNTASAVLTLTQEQVQKLEGALLEMPAKFALPIINLINSFTQENAKLSTTPVTELEDA